jgi:cell division topological specificity factor
MREKIYNILSVLNKIFGKEETGSKERAKDRLKLILISDRAQLSPQILERLKEDLIKVISNYIEVETNSIEVFLEREETQVALTASMPVKRVKRITGIREKVRGGK